VRAIFVRNLLHPFDGVDSFHGGGQSCALKRNANEISARERTS
jgi:hypothetical protein